MEQLWFHCPKMCRLTLNGVCVCALMDGFSVLFLPVSSIFLHLIIQESITEMMLCKKGDKCEGHSNDITRGEMAAAESRRSGFLLKMVVTPSLFTVWFKSVYSWKCRANTISPKYARYVLCISTCGMCEIIIIHHS